MAGEIYVNLLYFERNKKVQNFVNIMFGHSMICSAKSLMVPIKNNPTCVTKGTVTCRRVEIQHPG